MISSTVTMSVPFSMGAIIDIVMQKMGTKERVDYQIIQSDSDIPSGDVFKDLPIPPKDTNSIEKEPDGVVRTKSQNTLRSLLEKTGSLPGLFTFLAGVFVGTSTAYLVGALANAGRQILMACASER